MSEPITECSSVISSIRALPSQANNPIHCEYLFTRGVIVNNQWNGKSYQPPQKSGCPFQTSLNVPKTTANQNCEGTLNGGKQCQETDTLVSIPSLVLMIQNNIDCSITPISIEDAFCNLTSDKKLCLPGECEASACFEDPVPGAPCGKTDFTCADGNFGTNEFKPNGLLAAVYNIALWQNYQYFAKKNVYEFIVYPYKNAATCGLLPNPNVKECADLEPESCKDTAVPVLGTFPFCIGGKYSCACINLLLHGEMNRDESSEGCITSNLHWVGVRLYFKNKDGNVCSKNPASVHIQANPSDPLKDCFKPYFATTRPVIAQYEKKINSCPPTYPDCAQQFGPTVTGQCGTYPQYPIPPCPVSNSPFENPCGSSTSFNCEVIDLIWVNDCIDFDEFTCFQTCNIFIVLLPTYRCKSIIC